MIYSNTHTEIITIKNLYSEELDLEFDLDVEVIAEPGFDGSKDEPAYGPEVTIDDIAGEDYPVELSYNEMWQIIEDYEDHNQDEILDMIYEEKRAYEDDKAEYLYEQRKYSLGGC